jgi:alkanesulfonate monooxygenase SsuD/methylene tetrahydromethanopterin reductase-like flavin-dependent oxidoreductase (luciferase family)
MAFRTHPWVAERTGKQRFAVQVFPLPGDPNPTESVIEAALVAEAAGLDGFFIGDHPGYHIEPWLHLANIAARCPTVQLGSVVNCVFHRHPSMMARMAADLDRISEGRSVLGLGIGWNAPEFAQLGVPFLPTPQRQDALDEALTIITAMFGNDPVTFSGEHYQVTGAHITSPSVQSPKPPVLVAGAGKRTIRQVVRWADIANFGNSTNTGNVKDREGYLAKLAEFRAACEEANRPVESLLLSHFTSWLMLAETNELAKAKLDRYFPNGLTEEQTRTRIWGDPDKVIAYFRDLAEVGFQYFVVQVQDSRDVETIRLLGEQVMPAITRG